VPRRIAIVEDEAALRDNYAAALRQQGYEVSAFATRASAMSAFQSRLPDLVLLDIGLGDDMEAGFEMCRELRTASRSLPLIFLTARDSDFDTVSGLRLGADDYLTKDVSMPHLLARISALFRRIEALSAPSEEHSGISRGGLTIDTDRLTVHWHEKIVELTLTEFWIVHSLARRPGHVRSREQLMQDANIFVDDGTITSHVKRIRRKFEAADADFQTLDTVYGMGYRWKA
jgi:two-component system OmpR family response regulator